MYENFHPAIMPTMVDTRIIHRKCYFRNVLDHILMFYCVHQDFFISCTLSALDTRESLFISPSPLFTSWISMTDKPDLDWKVMWFFTYWCVIGSGYTHAQFFIETDPAFTEYQICSPLAHLHRFSEAFMNFEFTSETGK